MKSKTIANIFLPMVAAFLTMALALPAAAQQVKMTVSGTATGIGGVLQPDSNPSNADDHLAGTGPLGSFTFRLINAEPNSPSSSSTCSGANKLYLQVTTGGGVFRFQDNSLLYVRLTGGSDCIDFSALQALCIRVLQITGGTGRFKHASGELTLTETVIPVLFDVSGTQPILSAVTGGITGSINGVREEQDQDEGQ